MNDDFYKQLNGESPTGQPEKRLKENEVKEKRATELIIAEEALRSNQRQLRDIIEFLSDATLAIDKEKRVIIWNKAMEKMTSIPAAEMIGKGDYVYTIPFYGKAQPQLMDLVFLDDEEIATRYPNLIREGDTLMGEVFCSALNNKKGAWVFGKASPLHDQAGNIIGAIESIRDITERKNAEEALRSNQRQLKDIIEFLPDATLAIDNEKRVIIWNKAIEKMTCIPAAEMIGKSDYDYTIPFYGEAQPLLMDLLFLDDEEIVTKHSNLTREGDTLMAEVFCPALYNNKGAWIFFKASPLHDQAGNIIGAIESIRDITERKQAEEEILESRNFLEILLESIPAPVFYKDINGRYSGFNQAYENFFGKTKEELIGKSVFDISPVKLARIYHTKDAELFECPGTQIYETQVKDARGVLHDVVFYKATMVNSQGKVTGLIGTVLDITERKRLETALSNEKMLLETTLTSVGDGVISTDNKGNVMFLNRVAEFLTGWTQEVAMGKSIQEVFNIVNEFTREKSENVVSKVLESGKILELADHTILISKDGIERPIEDSAAPIVQENGEIVGVVLVFRDFSEKKQKQEKIEFLSYHDQLTGLYNRRFYEEELERLDIGRNLPIAIIMGDVNGLKLINDSFGHAMGDELLKKVAEVMIKGCRADDIIARLGGDEFVIILPKTDTSESEKIIKLIKDLLLKEKVCSNDISVSFGWETKNNAEEKVEEIFNSAEDHMYKRKLVESPSMRENTISAISSTLHEKSKREEQHSDRVSALCKNMGEALGLPENKIEELKSLGFLHDIGKIAIDENILNKSGELTDNEWKEIKRHPEVGYRILSTVNEMSEIAKYVLHHHERWDGKGYPKGLKSEEILLQARIIAIADAYDAMTSDRTYKKAFSEEEAINEIRRCSGTQFDPEIVRVFVEKVLGKTSEL
jgi:diguanylate cyclase (GGDEF)-like protein/PAS domain S-box-containing protein